MFIQFARTLFGASALLLLCGTMIPSGATAQEASMEKRMDRVERQLNAVQRKVFGGSAPDMSADAPVAPPQNASGMTDLDIRMTDLENQLRQTTGQVEQANFKIEQLERRLEAFMKDTEYRFSVLEGKGQPGAGAGAASTGAGTVSEAAGAAAAAAGTLDAQAANAASKPQESKDGLPSGTATEQYDHAYSLLSAGKYFEAEQAFTEFLKLHPKDDLSANAQYWLAQTYYVRGDFDQAAQAFLAGYQKYPKSPKAPAYLLKIGITLTKIGHKSDACDVFRELATQFPNSPESKTRRPIEAKTAGCN